MQLASMSEAETGVRGRNRCQAETGVSRHAAILAATEPMKMGRLGDLATRMPFFSEQFIFLGAYDRLREGFVTGTVVRNDPVRDGSACAC